MPKGKWRKAGKITVKMTSGTVDVADSGAGPVQRRVQGILSQKFMGRGGGGGGDPNKLTLDL